MRWYIVLSLLLTVIGYLCIGALVFMTLEHGEHVRKQDTAISFHKTFMTNRTCISEDEMKHYVHQTLMFYKHHRVVVTDSEDDIGMTPSPWNYYNSIFFSMTVVSTIGNGRLAPVTFEGRLFVVFYALIGIPLFGVMLMGIGSKIAKLMNKLNAKVCCPQRRRFEKVVKTSAVVTVGLAFFLCVPAVAIMYIENWTYGEGFYFAFVTLSTIGFGDSMIGTKEREYQGVYMILSALWILLGLSWVAFLVGEVSHASHGQKDEKTEVTNVKSGEEDNGNSPANVENGKAGIEEVDAETTENTKKNEPENTKL